MNFVTFNQDYSYLAVGMFVRDFIVSVMRDQPWVGTSKGFRIYTTDPFSKSYETREGNIAILEMLFSTSLVALILSPRRLQITNTKVSFRRPIPSVCFVWTDFVPATIHDMRVDLSHHGAGRQVEPNAPSHCPGGPNISLRYSDNEATLHHPDLSKSERYVVRDWTKR